MWEYICGAYPVCCKQTFMLKEKCKVMSDVS